MILPERLSTGTSTDDCVQQRQNFHFNLSIGAVALCFSGQLHHDGLPAGQSIKQQKLCQSGVYRLLRDKERAHCAVRPHRLSSPA